MIAEKAGDRIVNRILGKPESERRGVIERVQPWPGEPGNAAVTILFDTGERETHRYVDVVPTTAPEPTLFDWFEVAA